MRVSKRWVGRTAAVAAATAGVNTFEGSPRRHWQTCSSPVWRADGKTRLRTCFRASVSSPLTNIKTSVRCSVPAGTHLDTDSDGSYATQCSLNAVTRLPPKGALFEEMCAIRLGRVSFNFAVSPPRNQVVVTLRVLLPDSSQTPRKLLQISSFSSFNRLKN